MRPDSEPEGGRGKVPPTIRTLVGAGTSGPDRSVFISVTPMGEDKALRDAFEALGWIVWAPWQRKSECDLVVADLFGLSVFKDMRRLIGFGASRADLALIIDNDPVEIASAEEERPDVVIYRPIDLRDPLGLQEAKPDTHP
jgi:hypothetical protein